MLHNPKQYLSLEKVVKERGPKDGVGCVKNDFQCP